jgi:YfiH family protein
MMHFKNLGDIHKHENFMVFFGNRQGNLSSLAPHFPAISVLKQVHGDKLIKTEAKTQSVAQLAVHAGVASAESPQLPEADAHWCDEKKISIAIKTADCLPVIVCSPQTGIALGIHAGWRGVQQKIVSKCISMLNLQNDPKLGIFIGPHIQLKSFEVDRDVAIDLLRAHNIAYFQGDITSSVPQFTVFMKDRKASDVVFEKNGKFYVNLSALVSWELLRLYIPPQQIYISDKDTKTDGNYFSYRRGEKGVSNYSLVTRL